MKISLIFLTLNEITGLKALFHKIPLDSVDEVLAIDGGSDDGTIEFFKQNGIPVAVQEEKGRGEAFRLAFKLAKGDALIFFSPDGNEDPKDIPKFRAVLEQNYDIVIATRMIKGAKNEEDDVFWKWRKWANLIFTWMANAIWNKKQYVTDTINGYRAITTEAWHTLSLDGSGYTIEIQCSIRAFKKGLSIGEFPTCESSRIDHRKGSPTIRTGLAFIRIFLSELLKGDNWTPLPESRKGPTGKSSIIS